MIKTNLPSMRFLNSRILIAARGSLFIVAMYYITAEICTGVEESASGVTMFNSDSIA